MSDKIRLLLVDGQEIFRAGLRALIGDSTDMEVVGEAAEGEEALKLAEVLVPDVVLMDVALRNISGIEATRRIRQAHPNVRVLAVTAQSSPECFFELLKAEAVGYVLKEAAPSDLFAAIHAAHRGEPCFYPSIARYVLSDHSRPGRSGRQERSRCDGLSNREQEVLRLIAAGHSNREIAEKLVISVNTVDAHGGHIIQKLNLHSRAELVRYAMRKGLIDLE